MKKQIIIEIGTNTIKALSTEQINSDWQILSDTLYPSRLGAGLAATGKINPEAMERNLQIIEQIIKPYHSIKNFSCKIIATESLRSAVNADAFMDEVRKRFDLQIEIISGQDEARYAFMAAITKSEHDSNVTAVLDIGGGSTELTIGQNREILFTQSLAIGAVRLTEQFIKHDPPQTSEWTELNSYIEKKLEDVKSGNTISRLLGVGGTITTLALLAISTQLKNQSTVKDAILKIDGSLLKLAQIKDYIAKLSILSNQEKQKFPGMPDGRADIILAGTLILDKVMTRLNMQEISVSTNGVRHGYLYAHCR